MPMENRLMSDETRERTAAMSDHGCDEVLRRVHDFLDGELTPERRQEIGEHLDCCGHCLEAFDFEAELKMAISATCRDDVPPGLVDRLRAVIDGASFDAR